MTAAVEFDLCGCPNRCRHCWLGHGRLNRIPVPEYVWVAEQFRGCVGRFATFSDGLIFSSWFREPDFCNNYSQLWDLDRHLSTVTFSRGERELASIWRLVRDPEYVVWLKDVGVRSVQLSLFGMERNTDYYTGRRGSFEECLKAIDILLGSGIIPRIQMFPLKDNLTDFGALGAMLATLRLEERAKDLGGDFKCFLQASLSPVGGAFELENKRINRSELMRLPAYFLDKTLDHFKAASLDRLWQSEAELMRTLVDEKKPLSETPRVTSFLVTSEFDVYPNCGEIAPWWGLGNLKTDGVESVVNTFEVHGNTGLRLNFDTPISRLAARYGDDSGDGLYTRTDLGERWIRLEGMAEQG